MTGTGPAPESRTTVVVATRDRRDQLLVALGHLTTLPEAPLVMVVDNGSSDATPEAVRAAFPAVTVIALDRNEGSAARNIGATTATTPFVAFADDDSWWSPGSLARAAELMDAHPDVGLLAARVLIGSEQRLDPTSVAMAEGQLDDDRLELPGRPVLGFLACAAVVRRGAFLDAGGFSRLLFFLGEEALLAWDLAARGWALRYVDELVAHHHPVPSGRDPRERRILQQRNALLATWLRRPAGPALRVTARATGRALVDPTTARGLARALRQAPTVRRERRVVPPEVEGAVRRLEAPTA
jgi:GT2 family glycosyltransferase